MAVDLTIRSFIEPANQSRSDLNNAQAPAMTGSGWSVANTITWTGLLNSARNDKGLYNLQAAARYLLSLYALTVKDDVANTGDWSEIQIASGVNDAAHADDSNSGDKLKIKQALFGDGQQANALIQHLWFGMDGFNTYPQVKAVLQRLGIAVAPSGGNHQTHYHVDFCHPNGPVAVEAAQHLDSATSASQPTSALGANVLVNQQGEDMLKTLSAAALALAFAGTTGAGTRPPTIEPDQVNAKNIGMCEIYDPKFDPNDRYSGVNGVNPAGAIGTYVESYQKAYLTELKPTDYSIKYIEQPTAWGHQNNCK